MSAEGDQLLAVLAKLQPPIEDEKLARIVSYVDGHGAKFTTDDIRAIRERLLEVTGLDPAGLLDAFERGYLKRHHTPRQDDFSHLLPSHGLITDFTKMTAKTEWATPYRAFSIITVLGAMLGRQICVDRNVYRVWPNMATLLIGPTGVRKTTCIEYAIRMAIEADPDRFSFLEKVTSEAIHSWLAKRNPGVGVLYAPELSTVINKKDYTRNLINDLTRLWDCPDVLHVELMSRKETLHNVALSFLGASNEEWLVKSLPEDAHKGGFLARMIQVYVSGFEQIISTPKPVDPALRQQCLTALVETRRCQGVATLTRQADLYFDKRYKELRSEMLSSDPRIAAFLNRYHDHMLRLGLLLSVAEARSPTVYVDDTHLQQADGLLGWVLKWLPRVYTFTGLTEAGEDARRVLYVLSRAGGRLSRRRLIGELYGRVSIQKLEEILRTLQAADFVRAVPNVLFDDGPLYYTLTDNALREV